MPYLYDEFDGVDLPSLNASQTLDPNGMGTALVRSVGGLYDQWGDVEGAANPQSYRIGGSYIGQLDFLVDETGDTLVDETGDELIDNSAIGQLRSQVAELRTKIRVRGNLWRVRQDDGAREWKLARMLTMSHTITYQEPCPAAVVVCQIETGVAQWHAETVTTVSASAVNSVALNILVENVGETVDDAIVTVARSSGTVTAFSLVCAELGISLVWTGSMGAGHVLTIDAGAQTVVETGVDGYSGFSLVSHTAPGWLTLPYGIYTFIATVVGGNANIAFNYYPQFN